MIQSLLMLFAPAQEAPVIPSSQPSPGNRMATRPQSCSRQKWRPQVKAALAIAGNSLGLLLFLAGLGLVLRLGEVLLS